MSEQAVETTATDVEAPQQDPAEGEQKVDQTDWKAKAREWEKRAKANNTAAERLAALEESQKTEQQKLAERAAAAEERATRAEQAATRLKVITESGLPANLHRFVVGNDEDELRDAATALKSELAASLSPDNRAVDVGLGPRGTAPAKDINAQLRRAAGRS